MFAVARVVCVRDTVVRSVVSPIHGFGSDVALAFVCAVLLSFSCLRLVCGVRAHAEHVDIDAVLCQSFRLIQFVARSRFYGSTTGVEVRSLRPCVLHCTSKCKRMPLAVFALSCVASCSLCMLR